MSWATDSFNQMIDYNQSFISNIAALCSNSIADVQHNGSPVIGEANWQHIIDVCEVSIVAVASVVLCCMVAAELYSTYCKTNGQMDLEIVMAMFFRIIIPILLVSNGYAIMDWFSSDFLKNIYSSVSTGLGANINWGGLKTAFAATTTGNGSLLDQLWYGLQIQVPIFINWIMSIVVTCLLYVRLIEMAIMYLVSPIPIATLVHHEQKQVGINFFKMYFALLLQGLIILICYVIYSYMIQSFVDSTSAATAFDIWGFTAYQLIFVWAVATSGHFSKRILGTF